MAGVSVDASYMSKSFNRSVIGWINKTSVGQMNERKGATATYPINEKSLYEADNFKCDLEADWNDGVKNYKRRYAHESGALCSQFWLETK